MGEEPTSQQRIQQFEEACPHGRIEITLYEEKLIVYTFTDGVNQGYRDGYENERLFSVDVNCLDCPFFHYYEDMNDAPAWAQPLIDAAMKDYYDSGLLFDSQGSRVAPISKEE